MLPAVAQLQMLISAQPMLILLPMLILMLMLLLMLMLTLMLMLMLMLMFVLMLMLVLQARVQVMRLLVHRWTLALVMTSVQILAPIPTQVPMITRSYVL